jgi:hypothetical protein
MLYDVIDVRPAGPREIAVRFEDGLSGTVFIDASFCIGVFAPLLDDAFVHRAGIDHGAVAWPGGLDLAPDTMYQRIAASPTRQYRIEKARKAA